MKKKITLWASFFLLGSLISYGFALSDLSYSPFGQLEILSFSNKKEKKSIEEQTTELNQLFEQYNYADCKEATAIESLLKQKKKEIFESFKLKKNTTYLCDPGTPDPCPTMEVLELLGIPGFSQTDELVVCGREDTLAFLIYIEEPGEVSGTQMTVDFKPGMQFSGTASTHYPGTFMSVVDPNPDKPRFLLDGVTDGVYVGYIGVESNCDADIDALTYSINLKFNFIYEDTCGNFQQCQQFVTPLRTYNSVIREPVLNWQSVPNTTISALETNQCTNVTVSQNGIQAYLEEFDFKVCNLNFSDGLQLNTLKVNGTDIPYDYSAGTQTLSTTISGDYFIGNSNANPADTLFDTDERITIQFCYQIDECPIIATYPITYKLEYGCFGDQCQYEEIDRTINIAPTVRPAPISEGALIQNPSVCGDPGIIELKVYSNNADPKNGLFTDMTIGFETCEKPSLSIAEVAVNGTPIPVGTYTWVQDDILIDFSTLTSDPDGSGGLSDYDGDGFFDDLPGGDTLNVTVELEFQCVLPPSATSVECGTIDCSFAQFFVAAKRDCGRSFKIFPGIDNFNVVNGGTYIASNETAVTTSYFGIDFAGTGTSGTKTRTVEVCYVYEQENVEPCDPANSTSTMQVIFKGSPIIVHDVEINDPASIMVTVNGVLQPGAGTFSWDSLSQDTRALMINAGSNNIGDTVCIKYDLTADTARCSPYVYMVGTHQVLETCDDGAGCTCKIVKACENINFRSDPNATGCLCNVRGRVEEVYRESTGFTDATMTTKIAPKDVPVEDRNRYLPCDTMLYTASYSFETDEIFDNPYQWYWGYRTFELGGGGTSVPNVELMIDAKSSSLVALELKKKDAVAMVTLDLDLIPSCAANDPTTTRSSNVFMYYGDHPFDESKYMPNFWNENSNSSYDYYDNTRAYFGIRNLQKLADCRAAKDPNYVYPNWDYNGNCLDDFIAYYNIEKGDSIFITSRLVLKKNPFNVVFDNPPTSTPRIYQDMGFHVIDPLDSDCLVALGACRENFPYETYCPDKISAVTEIELDDCGGVGEHRFVVDNTTPVNWYTNEYRPYFQMKDIDIEVYSPSMFCGNAKAITPDGREYPLEIKDAPNHTCNNLSGQTYCVVSVGNPGTIVLNPTENGYPGLGVGLGGTKDTLKIVYDLCLVCPGELEGISEYQLKYDYELPCDPPDSKCYICNGTSEINNEIPACLDVVGGNGRNYYDFFDLDTLTIKNDRISLDVTIDDVRNGFPDLTQTMDRTLVSSAIPGSSEEINTFTIKADPTDPTLEVHKGVLALIRVANSVALQNIYDKDMALLPPPTFVTSDGTTNTYRISLPDLAAGDSTIFKLGTTLLFCPFPPLPSPKVCVTITSGCMDPDIQAAVAADAKACNTIEKCYEYTFGVAAIQADIVEPLSGVQFPLCGEIPVAILIKNVRNVTVTDLIARIDLPTNGATPVLGSFEASYPNAGDMSGATPFYSIPDPTFNGSQLIYTEDNDFSNAIHSNGFPGVSSGLDSNNIIIRFLMKTDCDEFVSGSQIGLEAFSNDPCSPEPLESGYILSEPVVIQGANPADFAQILTTSKPAVAFCGGLINQFKITGLNISEVPSGDDVEICITLPPELVYEPGSVEYILPTGQMTGTITQTTIGGLEQICFDGVDNLPVGAQFTFAFSAEMTEEAACGEIDLGVDIKDNVEDLVCVDGGECDVFVQTSVNPTFGIFLKSPIETVDLEFTRECSGSEDPLTLCYEVQLFNSGPDYTSDVTFNLHDDLTGNNELDFYDPILDSTFYNDYFFPSGDTVVLTGCFEVEAINACPVILDIVYDSECNCSHDATPYFNVSPGFLSDVSPTTVLCPNQELGLKVCGNYTFTISDPAVGYMRTSADSIYFGLNEPLGEFSVTIDGIVGECPSSDIIFFKGLEVFDPYLEDTLACVDQPKFLKLVIPVEFEDFLDIQWSPTTYLNDGSIADPIFTGPSAGLYEYTVNLSFGNGCIISKKVYINVLPNTLLTIGGEDIFCLDHTPANLTTDAGWNNYEWYLLDGGFEILTGVTIPPAWAGPVQAGDYIVKGYRPTDICPAISDPFTVTTKPCVDLELTKEICNIDPVIHQGDSMTYCITVCNKGIVDSGLIYTVNDVEIEDYFPANLTYLGHSSTDGTYIANSPESLWKIADLAPGDCETLEIYARFDQEGTFCNVAEITQSDDYDDVDSEENNDDGDQSEDDEDQECVTIVFPRADIGDYVWKDTNQDGIQDTAEPAMSGVTVTLYEASTGLPIATQITNVDGKYLFEGIQKGNYYIEFDISGVTAYLDCVPSPQDGGTNDAADSDILSNGRTLMFAFDPTDGDNFDFDAGFHLKCEPTEAAVGGN